jgi:hypothetical protein
VLNEENYAQKAKVWMFSLICGREDGEWRKLRCSIDGIHVPVWSRTKKPLAIA